MLKADYGYLNYIFTVIWLIIFTVGLPVQILTLRSFDFDSQTLFIAFKLYTVLSHTSSIVSVVWASIIKRKYFLHIIENISEVDNKIRYTVQEGKYMNRNVFLNIISEIILLTFVKCTAIVYNTYHFASEPYYIIIIQTISYVPDICNALILFQFVNLVFMMKQRYSHLNKCLNNWIGGTGSRPIWLKKENEWCSQFDRTVHRVHVTTLNVSRVVNIEGNIRQTDIHLLRQIYNELYDISCLINDTYGVPILAGMCCMLTGSVINLYEVLVYFNEWIGENITYGITFTVIFFKVTFFCHTATNEARSSRILVEKLLLEGSCRNECVNELRMFSFQLQVMTNQYSACGFFPLNLRLFTSVVSVIATYIVILVQIK
jgi:hypothetical protein